MDGNKTRILVVDDSAYNRQTLAAMLDQDPGIEVIGRASNGKEALRMVFDLQPDVITLDLEMPEMDGFAFLRLLMAKRPLPVIVVSSHAERDNVFRALELGALDFIAKPGRQIGPDLKMIQGDLLAKIRLVRRLSVVRLLQRAQHLAEQRNERATMELPAVESGRFEMTPQQHQGPPLGVLGVAASTGGPPAIQQLLCALPAALPIAILVAQHMPARFTRAFAARLDKICSFHVCEATDGQPLQAGVVYISPGASNIEVDTGLDKVPRVRLRPPKAGATIVPSGDLLFKTAADAFGPRFCALVLTGMGSDGREGAELARRLGATVLAEDPNTAVMPGMPAAAIEAGIVDQVLALEELPVAIQRFADACRHRADSDTPKPER